MALNSSPALATDHFVPYATCCPLSAVAGSVTAFDMATEATAIEHNTLWTVSPHHSERMFSQSKPSTARKSPLHFVRGCSAFARLIQLMNLAVIAESQNYIEQPSPDNPYRLGYPNYLDQNPDIFAFSYHDMHSRPVTLSDYPGVDGVLGLCYSSPCDYYLEHVLELYPDLRLFSAPKEQVIRLTTAIQLHQRLRVELVWI